MTSDKAPPAGQTTRKPARKGKPPAAGGRGPRFGKAGKPGAGRGAPRRAGPPGALDVAILYGWHPVVEALGNPQRRPRRLMATENAHKRLLERFEHLPIAPEIVRPGEIDRLLEPDAVHQGLLLEVDPLPSPAIDSLPADALVLVLDQITDPHNVGAIVPAATGVLAKSASGGLEHVPFIVVRNLAEAMLALRERGFQLVGLDSAGPAPLGDIPLARPLGLVLGAEGKGLRQLTRERCSDLARLDMPGAIKSLNVSNAAAIALYAASRAAG